MADGDKFMYTGALLFCDQGCYPSIFLASIKLHRLYGPCIGTDIDTTPLLNVPTFVLCRVGTPCPCVPIGLRWEKYHDGALKIEKHHPLLVTSVCKCAKGGTIHVFDSITSLSAYIDKLASKNPMLKKAKQKFLSTYDKMLTTAILPPGVGSILDALGYGNELEGYGRGIRKHLQETVGGIADLGYNLITHPIDTGKSLAKTAVIAASYSPTSLAIGQDKVLSSMDKNWGTDLLEQKNAMEASLKSEAKDMANTALHGTSEEKAEVGGRVTAFVAEFFVGTKGVTKATKATEAVRLASRAKKLPLPKLPKLGDAVKGQMKVKSTKISYAYCFNDELRNFNKGYKIKYKFDKDTYLVAYHNGAEVGNGRSLKYWTTLDEANGCSTIEQVKNRLALLNPWGERNYVSICKIPAGTKVKHAIGTAKEQTLAVGGKIVEKRAGEGTQILFGEFDEKWVIETRKIP